MNGDGDSSTSARTAASVTIWNMCRPAIEPTRVFLRRKKNTFDSERGGFLRKFLLALNHQGSCVRFQIVLEETDDGGHTLKVLAEEGSVKVLIGDEGQLSDEALVSGVELSHGDFVGVYYRLGDGKRLAGPFAFEYLAQDELTTQCPQARDVAESSNERLPAMQSPLNLLQLPEEVLRMIFSEVPSSDVFFRVSAVCQRLNEIVTRGVPFQHFKIKNFTMEERAVLGTMIESALPISTEIEGVSFDENNQPTRQTRFFVDRLTKEVQALKLNISGRVGDRKAIPKLMLRRILPSACIRRLKYLEITGCFEFQVQNGCCFEELEELWIHCGAPVPDALDETIETLFRRTRYSLAALFGPQGKLTFPKLTSIGLVGKDCDQTSAPDVQKWLLDVRACPFERVQIHCEGLRPSKFPIAARFAKTLKIQCCSYSEQDHCESFKEINGLENLAIAIFTGTGGKRSLESAPPSIKVLQLRVPQMRVELLEIIFERFSDLELLCVRFAELEDQINEETVKRLSNNSLKLRGISFQEETEQVPVLRNDLVEERLQRTEDFWAKKIGRVFGPLDYVVGSYSRREVMDTFDPLVLTELLTDERFDAFIGCFPDWSSDERDSDDDA